MQLLSMSLILFIFPYFVYAHNGVDEMRDLKKNKQKIFLLQNNISDIEKSQDRIANLKTQLDLFRRNILILRNKMIEESPKIKSTMSKYDLDYLKETDYILKNVNRTLKGIETVLHE